MSPNKLSKQDLAAKIEASGCRVSESMRRAMADILVDGKQR